MVATENEKQNYLTFHDQLGRGLLQVTPFNDPAHSLEGNEELTISLQYYAIEGMIKVTNSSGTHRKI